VLTYRKSIDLHFRYIPVKHGAPFSLFPVRRSGLLIELVGAGQEAAEKFALRRRMTREHFSARIRYNFMLCGNIRTLLIDRLWALL